MKQELFIAAAPANPVDNIIIIIPRHLIINATTKCNNTPISYVHKHGNEQPARHERNGLINMHIYYDKS